MTKPITKILFCTTLATVAYLNRDEILVAIKKAKKKLDTDLDALNAWSESLKKVIDSATKLGPAALQALEVLEELSADIERFSEDSASHIEKLSQYDSNKK